MKKKAIILKILFATFISSTLLASTGAKMEGNAKPDTTKIKVQKGAGGNIYDLIYFTDSISRLKIALLDEEGKTLHHDVLNINSPFMRPYNLENLPSGNYTFVIIDNGTKMEKQFGHKNKAASQNTAIQFKNNKNIL